MTDKDYALIAKVIAKFPDKRITKADLVIDLTKALMADNERFDTIKFVATCLGLETEKKEGRQGEGNATI